MKEKISRYEDQELWYPVRRLTEAGGAVTLAGPEAGKAYKSTHGYPATADKAAEECDGVIIPGGYAPDRMRHEAMVASCGRRSRPERLSRSVTLR